MNILGLVLCCKMAMYTISIANETAKKPPTTTTSINLWMIYSLHLLNVVTTVAVRFGHDFK